MVVQSSSSRLSRACRKRRALRRAGRAAGKGGAQVGPHDAVGQLGHELHHALPQLAGGEFGEGDGGDRARMPPGGQQHRHPPGQHRGLARPGARFDQQGAVERGQRGDARGGVGRHQGFGHHASSQISAASPSCCRAASRLRSVSAPGLAGSAKARAS